MRENEGGNRCTVYLYARYRLHTRASWSCSRISFAARDLFIIVDEVHVIRVNFSISHVIGTLHQIK